MGTRRSDKGVLSGSFALEPQHYGSIMLLYSIFIFICLSASAAAKSFPDYRSQNSLFDRNDQPIQCGVDQFPPPERYNKLITY